MQLGHFQPARYVPVPKWYALKVIVLRVRTRLMWWVSLCRPVLMYIFTVINGTWPGCIVSRMCIWRFFTRNF